MIVINSGGTITITITITFRPASFLRPYFVTRFYSTSPWWEVVREQEGKEGVISNGTR
jgi:hypothetical protein